MRKLLIALAVAGGMLVAPGGASAALLSAPLALGNVATDQTVGLVHWRGFRHCHPRRGFCHGGRPLAYRPGYYGWGAPVWGPAYAWVGPRWHRGPWHHRGWHRW
jgi:hypothetical protein